jgi:hypothetical protein
MYFAFLVANDAMLSTGTVFINMCFNVHVMMNKYEIETYVHAHRRFPHKCTILCEYHLNYPHKDLEVALPRMDFLLHFHSPCTANHA